MRRRSSITARIKIELRCCGSFFSITLLLKTLFDPWKRDVSYAENISLNEQFRLLAENLVSRFSFSGYPLIRGSTEGIAPRFFEINRRYLCCLSLSINFKGKGFKTMYNITLFSLLPRFSRITRGVFLFSRNATLLGQSMR